MGADDPNRRRIGLRANAVRQHTPLSPVAASALTMQLRQAQIDI